MGPGRRMGLLQTVEQRGCAAVGCDRKRAFDLEPPSLVRGTRDDSVKRVDGGREVALRDAQLNDRRTLEWHRSAFSRFTFVVPNKRQLRVKTQESLKQHRLRFLPDPPDLPFC